MDNFKLNKVIIIMIVSLILALSIGCATKGEPMSDTQSTQANTGAETTMTLDELAKYNGQDQNPAYVAVDGVIYDVSNSSQWKSGMHGGNNAGKDISEKLHSAPHGVSKVDGLPIIGKLSE